MSDNTLPVIRRRGLISGACAAVILLCAAPRARAGKSDKADFMYQDKPKGNASCATCKLFVVTPSGSGECAVVEGSISRNGWCMAYSARNM